MYHFLTHSTKCQSQGSWGRLREFFVLYLCYTRCLHKICFQQCVLSSWNRWVYFELFSFMIPFYACPSFELLYFKIDIWSLHIGKDKIDPIQLLLNCSFLFSFFAFLFHGKLDVSHVYRFKVLYGARLRRSDISLKMCGWFLT